MKAHWTERSTKDYLFSLGANFIAQLEEKMKSIRGMTHDKLAEMLDLSKGRISQIFNIPGNITLLNIVKFARVLGMKVAIVVYEDADPQNKKGLINPEVFKACWEKYGKPRDFWDIEEINGRVAAVTDRTIPDYRMIGTAHAIETLNHNDFSNYKELKNG